MSELHRTVTAVLRRILTGKLGVPEDSPVLKSALIIEAPREAGHGDLAIVAAMRLPKVLRKPPRAIGETLLAELQAVKELTPFFESMELAGPGFINLTLRVDWLARTAADFYVDERLGVETTPEPRTIVLDFSAPNVAKPMHVGHIRTTILGETLKRLLRFLGHTVIGDNHLGDWGTQFGMIIHGLKDKGLAGKVETLSVDEIETIYRQVSDRSDKDEATAAAARAEVAKLHEGDMENRRIWQSVMKTSLAELDATYARLGVSFNETLGESFYEGMLGEVVEELKRKGLAEESEGALAIFYEDEKHPPFLVRKKDGAFLYATSDIATVKYRVGRWHPDWILYIVDARQKLHFEQLFDACRRFGYNDVRFEHIWFGSILGNDGKPFRTRAGGTVRLMELLDEAERRAMAVVEEKNPDLSAGRKKEIARAVGIGALKYADLCQNRTSDYVFSWEKMLALQGNTAPYMQYAYARIRSIFRKGDVDEEDLNAGHEPYRLETSEEVDLAKMLTGFEETLNLAAEQFRPNFLTAYLYELAGRFSAFYDRCPVLKADTDDLRLSRLKLCDHTARVIRLGLNILGIDVIEQM